MLRRTFIGAAASGLASLQAVSRPGRSGARPRPTPSPSQLAWHQDELAMFLHFGVNTFTDREWGDGSEDPAIFNPGSLDARLWASIARSAGFKAMILTAKHHDGFCLWPTATTQHSVKSSPWRGGAGDVVKEFTDACRAAGLRAGLYCSPWDRNASSYGDSPRYNEMYMAQLTELLTRYGPIAEVWFDGANGEGPNGRKQVYDWPRTFALVRRLQPRAVMFSDAGPDVRWIGNERGIAGETCWSTIDPGAIPYPGFDAPGVGEHLQRGDPDGSVWRPGETDVSIRPGWFWHPGEDDRVRTADNLVDLYVTSVGRNSKLLLNVPPTRNGVIHDTDAAALGAFHDRRRSLFDRDLAARAHRRVSGRTVVLELAERTTFEACSLGEDIRRGQVVSSYLLDGWTESGWQTFARGTTIGHRKIDRFTPVTASRVRLTITETLADPRIAAFQLHG